MKTNDDINYFGKKIKKLRNSRNYTQVQVSQMAGINIDTLRRIENGLVTPRTCTLKILSKVYNSNLLACFGSTNSEPLYGELCIEIDYLMTCQNIDAIEIFEVTLQQVKFEDHDSEFSTVYQQIDYLVDALKASLSTDSIIKRNAITSLCNALILNHPQFQLTDIDHNPYTVIELRILFLLSQLFSSLKEINSSLSLANHLINHIVLTEKSSIHEIRIVILLYSNLSNLYHIKDNHESALKYANLGISLCQSYCSMFWLHVLCLRKGSAMFHLRQSGFEKMFLQSIRIIEIMALDTTKKEYIETFKKEFGFNLEGLWTD